MTPDGKFNYRGVLQSDHLDFFYDGQKLRVDFPVALETLVRQGQDGAKSLAELIREQLPGDLSSGSLLVEIPTLWGSFSIATPHPASLISDPLVLCRELELNAPDLPTAYHLDYHSMNGGALILALRSIVVEFLGELFKPLGLKTTAVSFQDQHEELQTFELKGSRSWSELLVASRKKPHRWPKVLLVIMLPLLVIGGLWLWGYRFTPGGFKNAPPLVADTTARLTGISITTTDSNRVDRIPVNGEVPAVALTNQSTVNDRAQVTIPTENNLAQQLLEMIVPDTLDYVAILPGWVTWRTREGHYDSLSLQSDREMLSFQQIEQRLLSYDDLIDMLNDSELDSAAKIVLLRDGNHFNLIWYH